MNGLDDLRDKRSRLITQGRHPVAIVCSEAGYARLCLGIWEFYPDAIGGSVTEWEGLPVVVLPAHTGAVFQEIAVKP